MNATKVLVSAYACGPGRGSEPGIGWNIAREIALRHATWLITSRENESDINTELAARPLPSLQVIFVDWPPALDWIKRTRAGYEAQHYAWQVLAYLAARRLHKAVVFDLVHHVTFGRYWMPSFMSLLPVPFLWGPVGGGESMPRAYWRSIGARGVMFELLREWARWVGERDPFLGLTARRSALALATTEASRVRMERLGARTLSVVSQVGLSDHELETLSHCSTPDGLPLRFVSIGRLLPWKGFHLGLRAFARLDTPGVEYWIIGDGPAYSSLVSLASELGIADRVRFCGGQTRAATLALLGQAHVLVHPSLHESGGMVCLEAMAAGKPVICLDLGGPALQVTDETGFKVSAADPERSIAEIAAAMRGLQAPALRERMGVAGRMRAAQRFNWRLKGDDIERMYAVVRREACANTR